MAGLWVPDGRSAVGSRYPAEGSAWVEGRYRFGVALDASSRSAGVSDQCLFEPPIIVFPGSRAGRLLSDLGIESHVIGERDDE